MVLAGWFVKVGDGIDMLVGGLETCRELVVFTRLSS